MSTIPSRKFVEEVSPNKNIWELGKDAEYLRKILMHAILAEAYSSGCMISVDTSFFGEEVMNTVVAELVQLGYEVNVCHDDMYVSW